ncbi:Glucose-1-phosphate thymidylyltransferase [Piscirickettsia salmonis]|uniref:Mannose-1-phosphate guanylyltransferase n=1 Tax=Piscirickettsia salmonis TaxID=1238 RepID=A0AAC8VJR7_PISSA|nr:nucleotidyltransferase family protein [Piscirickettsia salmonis]ALB23634.1 mannose-1-phosphate guanylyltransferase [Piscirickettsia salmonis]ALT18633.1 hypothetical protein PSLF89_3126 [Piscirickettsia salmonis LF-89 = ATCC VR-1361]AOS35532.1 hypothetical protein AVM72_09415 [Piscirickettsia salmonis]APS63468.1 hypothetical protein AVI54_06320 [Piscirickettsia salmonis]APS67234.1 hypothetical protein AVI55_09410 [Piscirickettsia salmonis]
MTIKAMILAAGRGERMRPLTDTLPKPLLDVAGKCLIEYRIEALVQAGIRDIVINASYQAERLIEVIGDGQRYGASIEYSVEEERLETGGGITQALPLLSDCFIVVNSDIWTDFDFSYLLQRAHTLDSDPALQAILAHFVLVKNPDHHPGGDLELENGLVCGKARGIALTYSGMGIYKKALFTTAKIEAFRVTELWADPIVNKQITGEHYLGQWRDIGTPERLELLRQDLVTRATCA